MASTTSFFEFTCQKLFVNLCSIDWNLSSYVYKKWAQILSMWDKLKTKNPEKVFLFLSLFLRLLSDTKRIECFLQWDMFWSTPLSIVEKKVTRSWYSWSITRRSMVKNIEVYFNWTNRWIQNLKICVLCCSLGK